MPVKIAVVDDEPVFTRTVGEIYDELQAKIKQYGRDLPFLVRLVPPPRLNEETGKEEFFADDELVVVSLDVTHYDMIPSDDPELHQPEHIGITAAIPDDFLGEDAGDDGEDDEHDPENENESDD